MCFYIKDRLLLESVAFVYNRFLEHSLRVRDIGREFDSWVDAVNLLVRSESFNPRASMSGLLISHNGKMSSMYRFQTVGLKTLLLVISVSIFAMNMLANTLRAESPCLGRSKETLLAG